MNTVDLYALEYDTANGTDEPSLFGYVGSGNEMGAALAELYSAGGGYNVRCYNIFGVDVLTDH